VVRVKTYITANEGFARRTLDYLSFMVMAFFNSLLESRPNVVVATSPQFFCAIAGWAVSVAKARPFVFELRDLWPASIIAVGAMNKSGLIRFLERIELFLYRRAAAIVPVTESFRVELMSRGIPASRVHVVINGVDLDRYAPKARDETLAEELGLGNKFVVGYLGTHGLAHALPKVLEAAELLRVREDVAFIFAGSGAERDTVERIVRERRLSNVVLVPTQPKEKMPGLWSVCDISLVPLRDNPVFAGVIPSKIFESMGMGVPVLISVPRGEATEIVERTGAGICVPPEKPDSMAKAIAELADDKGRVAELRAAARASAPQFSREALASKMLEVLTQVVALNSSKGR
jgi:glycosyltransferase involved in cell wall biosynthesis